MQINWITILIGLSLLITAVIPELVKDDKKRIRIILMGIFSIITYSLTEWRQNKNDENQKIKQAQTDSIYQVRTNSAVNKAIQSFGTAVGEYNLKIEKNFNGIVTLVRDSIKPVVNQIEDKSPYFGICLSQLGIAENSITFKKGNDNRDYIEMRFCAKNSTATDIELDVALIYKDKEGFIFSKQDLKEDKFAVQENIEATKVIQIDYPPAISDTIYFFVYGKYKNVWKTKSFIINSLLPMNRSTGKHIYFFPVEKKYMLMRLLYRSKDFHSFFKNNKLKY